MGREYTGYQAAERPDRLFHGRSAWAMRLTLYMDWATPQERTARTKRKPKIRRMGYSSSAMPSPVSASAHVRRCRPAACLHGKIFNLLSWPRSPARNHGEMVTGISRRGGSLCAAKIMIQDLLSIKVINIIFNTYLFCHKQKRGPSGPPAFIMKEKETGRTPACRNPSPGNQAWFPDRTAGRKCAAWPVWASSTTVSRCAMRSRL